MVEIENQVWQPLPGVKGVLIYPFLRKVDIISSNSFLVAAPGLLVLVDPGGLPGQADTLLGEIRTLLTEKPRPVLVCLTHVHLDHCHQLLHHPGFRDIPRMLVAVQESGARALESRDRAATIADLIHQEVGTTRIDIRLLLPCEGEGQRDELLNFAGTSLLTCLDSLPLGGGLTLQRQRLPLEGDTMIEFFPAPGHSPDSILIRIGETLFLGDLLFSTAPGVAGLKGWDQKALLSTLDRVIALLQKGGITLCLPGHGRPLDTATTIRTLQSMKEEALRLEGIESVNPEWARDTAAYAGELMGEVDRLFTVIAGRLVYVAHVLDELEEAGEAERFRGMIDSDLVDELLSDFNRFSLDFHSGRVLEIHLALKANQISQKLEKVFRGEVLGSVLDLSLVSRVGRLLEDYTVTFRGFRPQIDLAATDLTAAVGEVVAAVTSPPYEEDGIIEARTEEEFSRALAVRIAYVNPFEHLDIEFSPGGDLPPAMMDRERFGDTLLYILEKVSVGGARSLHITTGGKEDHVWVKLQFPASSAFMEENVRRFAARSCSLSNGNLSISATRGSTTVLVLYPVAGKGLDAPMCEVSSGTGETESQGHCTIAPSGRIDAASAPVLEEELSKAMEEGHRRIVVNLSSVDYMSSAGLRVLLAAMKRLKKEDGNLVLCAMKPFVQEVFDLTGFSRIFSICESEEEATRLLGP
ncbi:MAG: STAS domain protein [Methanoregulaceae archaeon PtaB.Bin056]|nr:MAG: STAS domain protein [Methanoregulaceae archaeon PtaB.Bin056]